MRDINRIDILLKLIGQEWKKHPDLRLCQLLSNLFEDNDLYYKEDYEVWYALRKQLNHE